MLISLPPSSTWQQQAGRYFCPADREIFRRRRRLCAHADGLLYRECLCCALLLHLISSHLFKRLLKSVRRKHTGQRHCREGEECWLFFTTEEHRYTMPLGSSQEESSQFHSHITQTGFVHHWMLNIHTVWYDMFGHWSRFAPLITIRHLLKALNISPCMFIPRRGRVPFLMQTCFHIWFAHLRSKSTSRFLSSCTVAIPIVKPSTNQMLFNWIELNNNSEIT